TGRPRSTKAQSPARCSRATSPPIRPGRRSTCQPGSPPPRRRSPPHSSWRSGTYSGRMCRGVEPTPHPSKYHLPGRGLQDGALHLQLEDLLRRQSEFLEYLVGVLAVVGGPREDGRRLVELQRGGHKAEGRAVGGLDVHEIPVGL